MGLLRSGGFTPFAADEPRWSALRRCETLLTEAGLDEPGPDARILLEEATGLTRSGFLLNAEQQLGPEPASLLTAMTERRLAREPVFRILGRREFWGLDLAVTPAVLDPRPDTETVVAAALQALAPSHDAPLRLLDLGTGSGAILLALLSELPQASGVGLDRSEQACAVARHNAEHCGLSHRTTILAGDFTSWRAETGFDLVVSNPPYIESAVIPGLAPEVRDHDPHLALDGGPDGLDAYRALSVMLPVLLRPGGVAVFEVGAGQAEAVAALLRAAGLSRVEIRADLGGHGRAVLGRLIET